MMQWGVIEIGLVVLCCCVGATSRGYGQSQDVGDEMLSAVGCRQEAERGVEEDSTEDAAVAVEEGSHDAFELDTSVRCLQAVALAMGPSVGLVAGYGRVLPHLLPGAARWSRVFKHPYVLLGGVALMAASYVGLRGPFWQQLTSGAEERLMLSHAHPAELPSPREDTGDDRIHSFLGDDNNPNPRELPFYVPYRDAVNQEAEEIEHIYKAMHSEDTHEGKIALIEDVRSVVQYRRYVAQQLLEFYLEKISHLSGQDQEAWRRAVITRDRLYAQRDYFDFVWGLVYGEDTGLPAPPV